MCGKCKDNVESVASRAWWKCSESVKSVKSLASEKNDNRQNVITITPSHLHTIPPPPNSTPTSTAMGKPYGPQLPMSLWPRYPVDDPSPSSVHMGLSEIGYTQTWLLAIIYKWPFGVYLFSDRTLSFCIFLLRYPMTSTWFPSFCICLLGFPTTSHDSPSRKSMKIRKCPLRMVKNKTPIGSPPGTGPRCSSSVSPSNSPRTGHRARSSGKGPYSHGENGKMAGLFHGQSHLEVS